MRATRSLLVLILIAAAGGCGRTAGPVAPSDPRRDIDPVQTSSSDSTAVEQRGVYTFGSGN